MIQTAALLLLSVYAAVSGAQTPSQSAYLDGQERFYIEWQYTDTNITILAKVKTTGWFGIGFSTNGGMAGADIITASVVDGVPYLQDRYAEKNSYPLVDQSQDVELLSGSEVDGVTTIQFTRKHNTCDDKDMIVGTDTMRVIYAISPDGSDTLSYHTPYNRGTKSVYLRNRFSLEPEIPDDITTVNVTVDDVEINAHHTMYHCQLMKAPKFKVKHHLIKAEPLITKENMGIVHHIIIYGCHDSDDREHHFKKNNTKFDCLNNRNMPPDIMKCRTSALVVWGIGGGPTIYPEEAGLPFGGDDSPDYLFMEMHYDNPQVLSGQLDSSGFRLTFTPTLRKYDAGILGAGVVRGIAIPPNMKDFTTTSFCSSTCTKQIIKNDLNIFGSFLHGHLSTTQIIARQFRDGKELDVVDEDRHYDFNYQQYKSFEKPIIFKPGDEMAVQCHHNTEDRVNMTFGGLASLSEMCIAFLSYYPAGEIDNCGSMAGWIDRTTSRNFVRDNLEYKEKDISSDYRKAFTQITDANLWTEKRVESLQNGYYDLPHMDYCLKRPSSATSYKYKPGKALPPKLSKLPPPARKYETECSAVSTDKPDVIVG